MEAQRLTLALGGQWRGHYGLAYCPAHQNTRTPALSLSLSEDSRLLAYCHAGCTFEAITAALRARGLLPGDGRFTPPDPFQVTRHKEAARQEAERRARQAQAIWAEAVPIRGTIAETYLRQARGITCPLPDNIRFCQVCWHAPSAQRLPAMVALIEGQAGFGIHRTYLKPDGSGKAAVEPAKAMLGHAAGGAVRIFRSGKGLAVAEGIESALSLLCGPLSGPMSVWAALSASGLVGLNLPPTPGRLIIASDGDAPGKLASQKLAARASALGWDVTLFPAPDGLDLNDVIRMGSEAAK